MIGVPVSFLVPLQALNCLASKWTDTYTPCALWAAVDVEQAVQGAALAPGSIAQYIEVHMEQVRAG